MILQSSDEATWPCLNPKQRTPNNAPVGDEAKMTLPERENPNQCSAIRKANAVGKGSLPLYSPKMSQQADVCSLFLSPQISKESVGLWHLGGGKHSGTSSRPRSAGSSWMGGEEVHWVPHPSGGHQNCYWNKLGFTWPHAVHRGLQTQGCGERKSSIYCMIPDSEPRTAQTGKNQNSQHKQGTFKG